MSRDLGWSWKPRPGDVAAVFQNRKRKPHNKRKKRRGKDWLLYAPGEVFYDSKRWKALRREVLKRYGYKCMFCDAVDAEMHVDHIKPRSRAPKFSLSFSNLQVLCRACNMAKWNHHATDYREESIARDLDIAAALELSKRL